LLKKIPALLSILTLVSLCSCTPVFSNPGSEEWILVQENKDSGQSVTYISHDAIKIVNKISGVSILAKTPDWKVYVFRPDEKKIWSCHLEQLSAFLLVNPYAPLTSRPHQPVVVRKVPTEKRQGSDQLVDITGKGELCGLRWTQYSGKIGSTAFVLRTADNINVAPKVAEVLARMTSAPEMDKISLFYKRNSPAASTYAEQHRIDKKAPVFSQSQNNVRDLRAGPQIFLTTITAKNQELDPRDFAIPKDYKRVAEATDVTYSKEQKNEITDFSDLGFASETKKFKDKAGNQK
jgi:hypothetical protein